MLMFRNRVVKNLEISGVNYQDYPDFCEAHFSHAEYENGTWLTDEELEQLSDEHADVISEMACDEMYSAAEDRYDTMMDR